MIDEGNGPGDRAPRGGRGSPVFAACLAASVAAHAAVLIVLPRFESSPAPRQPGALEVVILQPVPLPVAPPEPEPAAEPPRPAPQRQAAKAPPARADSPPPVLALPEPRSPAESAFTTPAPALKAEPPAAAPEPKTQVASVAPPAFNAAYLRNPAPGYPLAARRAGEQGTVTLRVLVARDGQPARVELEKSSGSTHLDNAALETVKGWRFNPARRGTEAVEGWVLVPIVFRLEG